MIGHLDCHEMPVRHALLRPAQLTCAQFTPVRMDITPHYHSLRLLLLDPELITAECCGDLGQDAKEFEPIRFLPGKPMFSDNGFPAVIYYMLFPLDLKITSGCKEYIACSSINGGGGMNFLPYLAS